MEIQPNATSSDVSSFSSPSLDKPAFYTYIYHPIQNFVSWSWNCSFAIIDKMLQKIANTALSTLKILGPSSLADRINKIALQAFDKLKKGYIYSIGKIWASLSLIDSFTPKPLKRLVTTVYVFIYGCLESKAQNSYIERLQEEKQRLEELQQQSGTEILRLNNFIDAIRKENTYLHELCSAREDIDKTQLEIERALRQQNDSLYIDNCLQRREMLTYVQMFTPYLPNLPKDLLKQMENYHGRPNNSAIYPILLA